MRDVVIAPVVWARKMFASDQYHIVAHLRPSK
jgi:hypothetical protein